MKRQGSSMLLSCALVAGFALAACEQRRNDESERQNATRTTEATPQTRTPVTPGTPVQPGMPMEHPTPLPNQPGVTTPGTTAAGPVRTDADIFSVIEAVNRAEIQQAELAQQKARNPAVRQFAQTMIDQHRQALQQETQMQQSINVQPSANQLTQTLSAGAATTFQNLQAAAADQFDRAYIDAQVREHREALQTIQQKLRPQATNAQVREHLDALIQSVQHHLSEAERIQNRVAAR